MYSIFTNIYPINDTNVGKYTIHGASRCVKHSYLIFINNQTSDFSESHHRRESALHRLKVMKKPCTDGLRRGTGMGSGPSWASGIGNQHIFKRTLWKNHISQMCLFRFVSWWFKTKTINKAPNTPGNSSLLQRKNRRCSGSPPPYTLCAMNCAAVGVFHVLFVGEVRSRFGRLRKFGGRTSNWVAALRCDGFCVVFGIIKLLI